LSELNSSKYTEQKMKKFNTENVTGDCKLHNYMGIYPASKVEIIRPFCSIFITMVPIRVEHWGDDLPILPKNGLF